MILANAKLAFVTLLYAAGGHLVGAVVFGAPFGMGDDPFRISICTVLGAMIGLLRGRPLPPPSVERSSPSVARYCGRVVGKLVARVCHRKA
jgi:hypothetical protein